MHRRRVLAALAALLGASTALQSASAESVNKFKHIVVIYQENHSFDNLYGLWGKVGNDAVRGLPDADIAHTTQVRQNNLTAYTCLLQNDVNLVSPPQPSTCADNTGSPFTSAFTNQPFKIDNYIAPTDNTCPAPGVFA